ncbi:MAG: branched-chain amino acid ABC transporter permease [Spirochaetes bacterium]|nr:MAG: branched-chain amino acid ABC transporter permease [Spirochaetota bacterium]
MNLNIFFQQLINGISLGGVYALMAVGFGIIFNVLKFSNFSHGGVVAICAYLGYFLATRVAGSLWITLLATTLLGGVVGVLVEKLVFRPIRIKGRPLTYFFVNSITVAMLVQQFFSALWGYDYYPYPEFIKKTALHIGRLVVSKTYLMMLFISALVLLGLTLFLRKTKQGIAIRAASSDIWTPSLMGINTDFIISITFFIAGVLAGITGYFLGMTYTVTPFIGSFILKGIIAAIVGGMGSLTGGGIAGVLLGVVESLLIAELGAAVTPIVIYAGIIILLLVRPQGIAGKLYTIKA